jgi:hypothetical protein
MANEATVLEYFSGEPLSIAALDESFSDPAFRSRIAFQTSGEEMSKLLADYHALLTARGGSPSAIESEFQKVKYLSSDQIRAKVESLKQHAEISAMPVEDIRKLANSRPAPEQIELPAGMTREYLLALSKPGEFKRVCERYGRVIGSFRKGWPITTFIMTRITPNAQMLKSRWLLQFDVIFQSSQIRCATN